MKNDTLVLLTSSYPYGTGETFIENELLFLSKAFKKIIIVSSNTKDKQTRITPANVILERYNYSLNTLDKLLAFKNMFSMNVLEEIEFTKGTLGLKWSFFKLKTTLLSLYKAQKTLQHLKHLEYKFSIINSSCVYYSYWMDDNAIALSLSSFQKKLCRVHGWDLFFERSREDYLPFRKQILENVKVFSVSERGKLYLKEKTNFDSVQLSRLGTQTLKRNSLALKKKNRIVSCSNVISLKRVDLIIRSLARIDSLDIEWVHFGDGPLLNEMKNLAKEMDLNAVFKGNVLNEEILNYLQNTSIDLFINLSTTEGIPVSIMEAFSCGIPAIATNVGGTSELVNNVNGILLEENPSEIHISQKINEFFLSHEEEIMVKREAAYNTWNEKFNAEKNYTEFAEIISNL